MIKLCQWRRPADKTKRPGTTGSINFPIAFTKACLSIAEMTNDDSNSSADATNYISISVSNAILRFGSGYQPSIIMIGQ